MPAGGRAGAMSCLPLLTNARALCCCLLTAARWPCPSGGLPAVRETLSAGRVQESRNRHCCIC